MYLSRPMLTPAGLASYGGGASGLCHDEATTTGSLVVGMSFVPWLSVGKQSAGAVVGDDGGRGFYDVTGKLVAKDFAELTSGTLEAALAEDSTGTKVGLGDAIWTGTYADGGAAANCGDWKNFDAAASGMAGRTGTTDASWTARGTVACDAVGHILCVER
jgi:hypothetical protein